jgi:hypothetical protein
VILQHFWLIRSLDFKPLKDTTETSEFRSIRQVYGWKMTDTLRKYSKQDNRGDTDKTGKNIKGKSMME